MNKIVSLVFLIVFSIFLDALSLGEVWQHAKPFWALAFFVIYILHYEQKYTLYLAVVVGLIVDLASSNILGQTSLALVTASAVVLKNINVIRFANSITLFIYLLVIAIMYTLVLLIPQVMIHGFDISYLLTIAPLSSTVVMMVLSPMIRRSYDY